MAALRRVVAELNVTVLQVWIVSFRLGDRDADHVAAYLAGDVAGGMSSIAATSLTPSTTCTSIGGSTAR